jgi:hypothetical protein
MMVTKSTGIAVGEEITVKYLQSGYYGPKCECSSCSGVDTSDMSVLKRKPTSNIPKQSDSTVSDVGPGM